VWYWTIGGAPSAALSTDCWTLFWISRKEKENNAPILYNAYHKLPTIFQPFRRMEWTLYELPFLDAKVSPAQ